MFITGADISTFGTRSCVSALVTATNDATAVCMHDTTEACTHDGTANCANNTTQSCANDAPATCTSDRVSSSSRAPHKLILISNNPQWLQISSLENYLTIQYMETQALDVLIAARDRVHIGWHLLNHPLYGNFRPYQQPFRSLLVQSSKGCPTAPHSNLRDFASQTLHQGASCPRASYPLETSDFSVLCKQSLHETPDEGDWGKSFPPKKSNWNDVCSTDALSLHLIEQALNIYNDCAHQILDIATLHPKLLHDCAFLDRALLDATLEHCCHCSFLTSTSYKE